jgi:large repetitive protein
MHHSGVRRWKPSIGPMRPLAFLSGLLLLAATTLSSVSPATAATTVLVSSFEESPPAWMTAAGSIAISSSTAEQTAGARSMQLSYNVSSAMAEAGSIATPPVIGASTVSALTVDIFGDNSWNAVYLRLRDATGEVLMYPVGTLGFSGWKALTVDLRKAAAFHDLGNDDGVLDYPLSLYRFVIAHNSGRPATGTIYVDNLRATVGWTRPAADSRVIVPTAGQSTTVRFVAAAAGDYQLTLTDELGAVRTWNGTASVGQNLAIPWDGYSGGSQRMRGNVRAILRYDDAPGGGLASTHVTVGIPYLTGAAAHLEPAAPSSIGGVNSFLTTIGDPAEVGRQARLMEDAYVRMAREEFEWKRLEPRNGYYDWSRFDQAVEIARSHNIELLGKLAYSAPWASSAPAGTSPSVAVYYPPVHTSDYAEYARSVVHRYKDRIHVWEIWNEPNSALFWKPAPSASAYATLLKAAYAAIKAEDPTATVVLGGLAGFDLAFLNGIRGVSAWGSFDALGLHTYTIGPPERSTAMAWLDKAQAYVERYGRKPIWITELGWSTYSGSGAGYIGVSETNQANYLSRAYLDAAARGVRGIFWYDLIEDGSSATSLSQNYGLMQQDGRLKPAYSALRQVNAALDQAVSVGVTSPSAAGTTTLVDGMNSTSGWTAVPLGGGSASITSTTARHGGTGALQLTYSFGSSGTGVELRRNLLLPGSPKALSVWLYGDKSGNPVYLKFRDHAGEYFQASIGSSASATWQRLVLHTDGNDPNWKHWSGDNDGVIDYPITLSSIYVFKGTMGITTGNIILDDASAHTGANTRGVVLVGSTFNTQALYRLGPTGSTTVQVPDTSAYLRNGSAFTAIPVTSNHVTVTLDAAPRYVASHLGLSGTTFNPNGSTPYVDFRWIAGDRATVTFQVLTSGGQLLRTLAASLTYDSGWRTFRWDGLYLSGGTWKTAGPGSYILRLTSFGRDGRSAAVARSVTIP